VVAFGNIHLQHVCCLDAPFGNAVLYDVTYIQAMDQNRNEMEIFQKLGQKWKLK